MTEEEKNNIFNNLKNKSIGNNKKVKANFIKTKVLIGVSVLTTIATMLTACSINFSNEKENNSIGHQKIEYLEENGITSTELISFEKLRTISLLNENNLNNYTETSAGRHYENTYTDYMKVSDLDDSYIHGFYLLSDDESVDEMCKGLGYSDFEDYMKKNNYVDENNNIDKEIWNYENMKVVVPIMTQGRQK